MKHYHLSSIICLVIIVIARALHAAPDETGNSRACEITVSPKIMTLSPSGSYPRAAQLSDGSLLAAWDDATSHNTKIIRVSKSPDKGRSWIDSGIVAEYPDPADLANAFPLVLDNGRILLACRRHDGIPLKRFRIEIYCSDDGGSSWKFLSMVESHENPEHALWEPFLFHAPDDSLHVYYARETGGTQAIVMRRSFDRGQTWGSLITVASAPDSRDGMPAVTRLKDESLLTVFEAFDSRPWGLFVIKSVQSFDMGISWTNRRTVYIPSGNGTHAGAPYVALLPSGHLMASFMTDEDASDVNWPFHASLKILVTAEPATSACVKWESRPRLIERNIFWPALLVMKDHQILFLYGKEGIKGKIGNYAPESRGAPSSRMGK